MYYHLFWTSFCEIILVGNESGLCFLHLNTKKGKRMNFEIKKEWKQNDNFFNETTKQLTEYFEGKRKKFEIKINPKGTDFQKKVWDTLQKIPYGKTSSYKNIAQEIGNKKAARAIGMANSKNPIPIIIPCHRVIGSSGKLVGFAHGVKIKKQLLKLEGTI